MSNPELSHTGTYLPEECDGEPEEPNSHFDMPLASLEEELSAATKEVIWALERRADRWKRPGDSPLQCARYYVQRRMERIRTYIRARSAWLTAGSVAVAAVSLSMYFLVRNSSSKAAQGSSANASQDADRSPSELLGGSLSFEEGKLGTIFLRGAQGSFEIEGRECIAMAGSDGKDYCFVMRLMNEEAAALCLPPEPTVLYLLSRRIQEERHSAIILPFGKESYCVLRGDEAGFHPCMREEDLAFLQPLLTDFPMLTRGSPTPKHPRWQDADSDGKLDRFYAWGGDRGVRRMNEVVLPQVRKLAGLE